MAEVSPAPTPAPEGSLDAMRLASDLRMVGIIYLVIFVQTIVMVSSDLLIAGVDAAARENLLWFRAASAAGVVFLWLRIRHVRDRAQFNEEILLAGILSAFSLLALQGLRPADNLVLARFELVAVVGMYAALPNRPVLQVIPAGILSVGAVLMYAVRPSNIAFVDLLTIAEVFVIGNVLGWYVSRRRMRLQASEEAAWQRQRETRAALEHTLGELRVLRGVLPICSHCRKIRSELGDWQQLELYVREHTDADFSHGLCPDCLHTHYPAVAAQLDRGPTPPM